MDGRLEDIWVYTVTKKGIFFAPSDSYLKIIKDAAEKHGFPPAYRKMLNEIETV